MSSRIFEMIGRGPSRDAALASETRLEMDTPQTNEKSGVALRLPPHCYEFCQGLRSVFPVFFFILKDSFLFCFLSGPSFETFSWRRNCPKRLLFLLSVHGPEGTAPVDTYGHSQETDAPNLQSGLLPAPVRLRARAVSNSSVRASWFG